MSTGPEAHLFGDRELDLATDFNDVLAAGYAIHVWNTGRSVRVAEIVRPGDSMGSRGVPKLGYGADGTAAQALLRARNSYFQRVAECKEAMNADDISAADAGLLVGAPRDGTYLDSVASLHEISFYQEDDRVVAEMPARTFGADGRALGTGADMVEALVDLQSQSGGRVY